MNPQKSKMTVLMPISSHIPDGIIENSVLWGLPPRLRLGVLK